ncbi:MAG TPA: hypothetical protein VHD57_18355 [Vicinamibacterales bacterium]|jgi:hypothetical protein|nr:hypothetical protein [Vicinamibacterales bacterium]
MSYAFPADLSDQVIARWQTFVARHDHPAPPLPPVDQLRYVLETAFFASFAREEGRHLQFVLCCAPASAVTREGTTDAVPIVPFQTPRRLTVDALRSLAPAVSPANAAILVRCPPGGDADACEITGVLHVGSNLARARSGKSIYHRAAPYALLIDVRDSGELHIYRGGIKLATLDSGSLQDQLAFSEIEFLPISDLLTRGGDAVRSRIVRYGREPEREASDFEWTALLNTVLSIVGGIQAHGHGGTLLLVAPGAAGALPVRTKFDVDERQSMLTDRFVAFLNARHAFIERRLAAGPSADVLVDIEATRLEDAMVLAEDALSDAADLVARLSAVDGALVVSSDLRVLGFGAEIVLDAARAVSAYEVTGHAQRPGAWPEVDSESFGMRHRSALRCVAVAHQTAAFVVSQDSAVSFFWKQDGRVLLKRGVTIANPNMAGV